MFHLFVKDDYFINAIHNLANFYCCYNPIDSLSILVHSKYFKLNPLFTIFMDQHYHYIIHFLTYQLMKSKVNVVELDFLNPTTAMVIRDFTITDDLMLEFTFKATIIANQKYRIYLNSILVLHYNSKNLIKEYFSIDYLLIKHVPPKH